MFFMVAWLILDNGNTFAAATLLTAVLGYHVQLSDMILNTQKTTNKV